MFNANAMNNNGMMNGGYAYQGMPQATTKFSNVLTAEQIQKLQQKSDVFSLALTEDEMLRAICNHRDASGTQDTLVYDNLTGEARCTICGYKFRPVEANVTAEQLKEDVERIVDILQTIKLMYIDLPAEAAQQYFPVIALLEKVPQLFEFAAKNMAKHESFNWQYNNRNMGAINMFANLQNVFGGMSAGYNPQMGQQMPNGTVPAYGNPQFTAPNPVMPQANAFGFPGASNVVPMGNPVLNNGYNPQTTNFSFTPNQTPAAVTPTVTSEAAPVATEETTVTQNINV